MRKEGKFNDNSHFTLIVICICFIKVENRLKKFVFFLSCLSHLEYVLFYVQLKNKYNKMISLDCFLCFDFFFTEGVQHHKIRYMIWSDSIPFVVEKKSKSQSTYYSWNARINVNHIYNEVYVQEKRWNKSHLLYYICMILHYASQVKWLYSYFVNMNQHEDLSIYIKILFEVIWSNKIKI